MCSLADDSDMPRDILNRVSSVASFLEEVLTNGRAPGESLELSSEALEGLVCICRDVNQAVQKAGELSKQ